MKNVTISGKLKKVGNSLALFIPASLRDKLGLEEGQTVEVEVRKKKEELAIFGLFKGKKIEFKEEDRLDVRY